MAEGQEPAKDTPNGGDNKPTPKEGEPTPGTPPKEEPKEAPKKDGEPQGSPAEPKKDGIKLPEGSLLDAGAVERIAAEAKAQGLTQEQAQAHLDRESKAVAAYVEGQQLSLKKAQEEWVAEAKSDKEIGGEGFDKHLTLAKRVVDRFGTDTFKKILTETGYGNHPELVRVFARIGAMMSEDSLIVPSGKGGPNKKSLEDIFYPSTPEAKEA